MKEHRETRRWEREREINSLSFAWTQKKEENQNEMRGMTNLFMS